MAIRVRLKEILEQREMSQRKLARKTGLTPNTINHYCSENIDRVHLSTLDAICKALEIDLHELLVFEDDKEFNEE
ncbi:helix-turn-helix domain-containing protein [Paenibacillus ehimensis]|uniref:Helix-turn-helix transcriptional regulator n=2 Tax=Paenibacillus ehimensis TaxID=79264 RepID=A0ABT8V920_9BACL|nr:helix-turn-helix transcriptional regulator [Paenibacillus ehimensis]MDO3676715.1 helix-turn-helix transcriptional regulator [Paenibacillus ehimensis]